MDIQNFTYAGILLIYTLIIAGILNKWNSHFFRDFRYVLPAIVISGALMIIVETRLSGYGIKNYNPGYNLGIDILEVPVEVWLSYLLIPFVSLFIYDTARNRLNTRFNSNISVILSLVLIVIIALIVWFFRTKTYTFFTFFLLLVYFGYTIFRNRFKQHLNDFYVGFGIALLPYLILEIIFASFPVISYDIQFNSGTLLQKVPIENVGFYFLLFLMNVTIFEFFSGKRYF
jgi:lycopene cyclase domain-containing protein